MNDLTETFARLCRIVALLRENPQGLTAAAIARTIGVSKTQVNTDLELLSLAGTPPVYTDEEGETAEAVWYLGDTGRLPPPPFSTAEVLALLIAGERQAGGRMHTIRQKLMAALLSPEERRRWEERQARVVIKGVRPFYDTPETESKVAALEKAILAERRLHFRYRSREGEEGDFSVEPYGLIFYWVWGFWYLVGAAGGRLGLWRVDRILAWEEGGSFVYPEDFSLEERFADSWGVELDGPVVDLKIRFYDEYNVVKKVWRETAHRRNRRIVQEEGSILYFDRIRGLTEIAPWIRSFGSSAVVLEPAELREEMIRGARWVLERHARSGIAGETK